LIDDAALEPYRQAEPVNGGLPSLPAVWIFIMGMVAMIAIPVFWIVFKKKNDT
jgi:LPXTG-motif cell wall-anchored protein